MQPINLVFVTVFALLHLHLPISIPREWLDWFESGQWVWACSGKVYRNAHFHNGICWTHGNFVARKKRCGWFSFLPAPRTLFFLRACSYKWFRWRRHMHPLRYALLLSSCFSFIQHSYLVCTRWKKIITIVIWSVCTFLYYYINKPHEYLCGDIIMLSV